MMATSKGERKIFSILQGAGIKFETEKVFDVTGFKGRALPYDFYGIYNGEEFLIEFQGIEHYELVPFFHDKKSDFQKRQVYDERKISYALAHNIKLYCIPCWEIDDINTIEDVFAPAHLATSKNHNYDAYRAHIAKT